jgi:uncharacterized protein YpmS
VFTWKQIVALVVLVGLLVALATTASLYSAVTQVQPYYRAALDRDPAELEKQSHQLESRFSALHSDVQDEGKWRTVISADELNGWLATKLPEAFPELLPKTIRDPRVAITPAAVFLAAQSTFAGVDTVVSVEVEPFVTSEGDLAIELRQVLAGALPLPKNEVFDQLAKATEPLKLPLRWTQNEGNMVLLVERRMWDSGADQHRVLQALELDDGQLYVSGRTENVQIREARVIR